MQLGLTRLRTPPITLNAPSVRDHLGAGPRRCDPMAKDKDNGLFVMKRDGDALPTVT